MRTATITLLFALTGILLSASANAQRIDSADSKESDSLPSPDVFIPNATPPQYDPGEVQAVLSRLGTTGESLPTSLTVSVFVRTDGSVQKVLIRDFQVLTQEAPNNPDFEAAILQGFKGLVFKPGFKDGQPIGMWATISIKINWE